MYWTEALWVLLELLLCLDCSLLLCMVIEDVFFPDVTYLWKYVSQEPPGHYPLPWLRHISRGNILSTSLLSDLGQSLLLALQWTSTLFVLPVYHFLQVLYKHYVFCSPLPYCTCMLFTSRKGPWINWLWLWLQVLSFKCHVLIYNVTLKRHILTYNVMLLGCCLLYHIQVATWLPNLQHDVYC